MGKTKSGLSASVKAVDPTLAALFSESAGPVQALPKSRYAELPPPKPQAAPESSEEEEDDEELSELDSGEELDDEASDEEQESAEEEDSDVEEASDVSMENGKAESTEVLEAPVATKTSAKEERPKRKRKQRDEYDDLESAYFNKLLDDDEPSGKRIKAREDPKGAETADNDDAESDTSDVPMHESKGADAALTEIEKANRTVFLSNVSAEAITSRKAKKSLLNHLSSVLDKKADPPQKVQSIRFRSTAFSTAAIPKRAAYIKQSVMEATTKSTNAYVVYSSPQAARLAVQQLNGTSVLDRHLRVDSVAHPAPIDHRRCVFVGNLGFVDDESVLDVKVDEEGKEVTEKRKRTRVPMDVEEGLWRVFSKEAGKVESVRVVRDAATRIGKGFAYVQFYDANAVEKAILLTDKTFPPMLPRKLRVSRCKAPHRTARAMEAKQGADGGGKLDKRKPHDKNKKATKYAPKPTPESQTLAGRAQKLLGRAGAAHVSGKAPGAGGFKDRKREDRGAGKPPHRGGDENGGGKPAMKSPEEIIFEGRRASAKDGKPKDLKFKGSKSNKKAKAASAKGASSKPTGRGAVRAAKWRAGGGVAK
ncbi:nucleolar protein 12 [Apodospora peruviana]|uniref:Nucleolar protein 12 n=1 Tax=Apodospora peruviana TaxID=516989 RepID=A0AAE0IPI7_9PEZI|nr:nucleolar protein 12 [Apodospora peruviana]